MNFQPYTSSCYLGLVIKLGTESMEFVFWNGNEKHLKVTIEMETFS